MSSGEIMSWLNSDDMYFPWAVEIVVKAMMNKNVKQVTGIKGIGQQKEFTIIYH